MGKNYLRKWRYDNITNEELNTALYEKLFEEQEKYRGWLLSQPAEEILNHAYEYTVREDILLSMEYNGLEDDQATALLRQEEVMPTLFGLFEDRETNYMDVVSDCITTHANTILREEQALRTLPVYLHSGQYAREHDELTVYRASDKANMACKEAIEAAIRDHYHDNCLGSDAVKQVVEQFGYDRVFHVLAVTVQQKEWDGRISSGNKAWAKTVPVFANPDAWGTDRNCYLVVNSHPGLTDLFLSQARKIHVQEQQKFSVRDKLKKQPKVTSPKLSAKSKGQDR